MKINIKYILFALIGGAVGFVLGAVTLDYYHKDGRFASVENICDVNRKVAEDASSSLPSQIDDITIHEFVEFDCALLTFRYGYRIDTLADVNEFEENFDTNAQYNSLLADICTAPETVAELESGFAFNITYYNNYGDYLWGTSVNLDSCTNY